MKWLEISICVDGELAEAVADVLGRHVHHGVATELIIDEENQARPSDQVMVRGYLPIDGSEEQLKDRIEHDLWHLRQIQHIPDPGYQLVEQQDWTEQWRQHYHPMPIGERLLLIPAWYQPPESSRKVLMLEPGMAFGTGTHPTSRLCLQALEEHIKRGDRVYDIGCGSGILSIASLLLGAGEVIAIDSDPAAIQSTRENAELNQVADRITLISGSLDELLAENSEDPLSGEIIVANILTKVLISMLHGGLTRLLHPGSKLILSGILADQTGQILEATHAQGLDLLEVRGEKDWRAMVFEKNKAAPRGGSSNSMDDSGG
ncbi:MAG: 50S ribosomal protein L11 methyltransferase [Anaerolineales bacterium]|nr:50S ribosomal protein L11 methyltransferase [Anaerolineales bacterium]